ncbi:anti-lipopolysaccharide factor-like [Homarus americanus]|uniref:Anti-lipopolysaccharide factor 1 n=1 Tax=Homarus americanus TaxID=6706 RepID=B2MVV5_HOMAM|nr:anti-lipopolysaccharide factor-like [Homarus americanus]ACC94268.1 anti-lipopolysaccharide factor 1 [Homarus americanus]
MRQSVLVSVLVVSLLVTTITPQCNAQGWAAVAAAVASKVVGLWQNGHVDLLDHPCRFSVKPTVRRFQLYFKGRMWCPGWTSIRGEAKTRSRSGVVGKTTRDFVNKAFQAGLITERDAQQWLSH